MNLDAWVWIRYFKYRRTILITFLAARTVLISEVISIIALKWYKYSLRSVFLTFLVRYLMWSNIFWMVCLCFLIIYFCLNELIVLTQVFWLWAEPYWGIQVIKKKWKLKWKLKWYEPQPSLIPVAIFLCQVSEEVKI